MRYGVGTMLEFCLICSLVLGAAVAVTGASRAGQREDALRFLALGDSYTIGEAVDETERWPMVLAEQIGRYGPGRADTRIIARTGWTTDELQAAMGEANLEPGWDLVSLLIGVNNQYRGRDVEEYRSQFSDLLERAVRLASGQTGRVFVVSIPDWGVTRFAAEHQRDPATVASEIDAFNDAARQIARERGVAFVDITDISRAHADWVAADGLHPSGRQYRAWVERILPTVQRLLSP